MRSFDGSKPVLCCALASVLALAAGCGTKSDRNDPGPARPEQTTGSLTDVNVSVAFPTDAAQSTSGSVHVWVLAPGADAGTTCNDLVGGAVDAYSPSLDRRGDTVSKNVAKATAKATAGKALVYVEAVDYAGNVEWAGCSEANVQGASTKVSVTLGHARVFDCKTAKDGSPCDDGKLCNVGETCQGGECQGGSPRDCKGAADSCNAGTCDEQKGCTATPIADGTPCDDQHACTNNDACAAGKCVGKALDCAKEAGPCRTSLGCDDQAGGCQFSPVSSAYGNPCDDGDFCTTNDKCDFSGRCSGTTRDCSAGGCAIGTCDPVLQKCVTTPEPAGQYCSDGLYCTTGDQCDGNGNCVGTPRTCTPTGSPCSTNACDESYFGCKVTYKPTGTTCNDGTTCTTGDQCDLYGDCVGTPVTAGTSCDDGSTCSTNDQCDGYGACTGTAVTAGTTCNDGSTCTMSDQCDGYGRCTGSYATFGTPCSDGKACTTNDQCQYGVCVGTVTSTCP
jgi:hypothetical protein